MSFGSLPSVLGNGGGVAISVIGGTGLFADGTAAAPSISFANSTNMGFFRYGPNDLGVSVLGATSFIIGSGGTLYGANGTARLTLPASGSVGLVAAGTNQNITLTPSGTGKVEIVNATTKFFFGEQSAGFGYLHILQSATSPTTANYTLLNDGAGNLYVNTANAAGVIVFRQNAAEVAQFNPSKRFLLGTATDSSNGILQLATHTTSAGGIGFGTELSLYRRTSTALALAPSGGTGEVYLEFFSAATRAGYIQTNGTTELIINGSSTLRLYTGGSQALNFDSSQVATFAKAVATTNGTITANTGTGANTLVGVNTSATGFGGYLRGGSTIGSGKYLLQLVNYDASKNYLFYDDIAIFPGALTLGGALKLNNAYVAGAVVGTGYVTIQDSTGTTYRVPVLV